MNRSSSSNRLIRASSSSDVPDFLSANWLEEHRKKPLGPNLNFRAEDAVNCQLDSLKHKDQPRPDYGVEVIYRSAGFGPFERSTYFGPFFDLGQNRFKHGIWISGARPEEEDVFQFTM
ncbi:hypothetical protein MKW94_027742, partial [Papaver nudicaule]|nr:hypothetical protein [Papaver nudicaule]